MSAKYEPKNRSKENYLEWKKLVKRKKDEQKVVNQKMNKKIQNITWQNCNSTNMAVGEFFNL